MSADRAMDRRVGRGAVLLVSGLIGLVLAGIFSQGDQPPPVADAHRGVADPDLLEFEARLAEAAPGVEAPVRREVPAPAAPAVRMPRDEEWLAMPITTFSFVRALADSPAPLQARWLFRNHGLNPADTYLEAGVRNAARAAFDARKSHVLQLAGEVAAVGREEFGNLIAAGALPPVHYADYVQRLDEQARQEHERLVAKAADDVRCQGAIAGLEPEQIEQNIREIEVFDARLAHGYQPFLVRRSGSDYYACRLSDLPRTCAKVSAYRAAFIDCVDEVARILCGAGALDEVQLEALVRAAAFTADGKFAP